MDKQREQEAEAIIERAQAYKGLITVLSLRLEQSDDPRVKSVAADLRDDPNWRIFTKGIAWYNQRRGIAHFRVIKRDLCSNDQKHYKK